MLIPKNIWALAHSASRDPGCYQLNGIFLERQKDGQASATSTNGKVLAHIAWPDADADKA